MTWIYCFIKSVANTYVEDNATTLQMMDSLKQLVKYFNGMKL